MAAPERLCQRHCNCMRQTPRHMMTAAAAAAMVALLLQAVVAPGTAQNTLDINDSFSDYNFVPAGRALYYDFVTFNYTSKAIPDVLVTLKSSGAVDMALYLYCNPSWFSATAGNSVPRPGNAIFSSEEAVLPNTIYISSENEVIRPPAARTKGSDAYNSYVPAYNCSVVSNAPTHGTRFQIDVAFNYRNLHLVAEEQAALSSIWDLCCKADVNATTRRVVDTGNGSGLDNEIQDLKCGRWAQNNDLYGGNVLEPYLDFCQIAGNACNGQGRLFKLDFSGYGLTCRFPVDEFAQFRDLESLDLSDNFDITGNLTNVFNALDRLQYLQMLDLSDAAGLRAPLFDPTVDQRDSGICLLASRLSVLNMAEIGMPGATLPDCLFDVGSSLQEFRIEFNSMTGTIPDVFTDTSPLRVFTALSAGLLGPIPETLTLCKDLEILDLGYNYLSGSIPADLGASRYLRYAYLMSNNLTGAIPESLALHEALESLDVSDNRLSGLPASWQGATTARINSAPLRNIKLSQNLFGGNFPTVFPLLPQLVLLQMDNNRFKGPLPNVPGMFNELRVFNITRNLMTGSIADSWGNAGIFKLSQINALGIQLLEEPTAANKDGAGSLPLMAQPQIFDVAANSLSGAVPSFLYANSVPDFVQPNVNLRYNKLTVRCSGADPPAQLKYLADATHLCPQHPPAGALAGLGENIATAEASASGTSTGSGGGSGGGLPAWGAALISIVVVVIVAAAAGFVGLTAWRARARGDKFSLAMLDPRNPRRGFKQFNDLEMASGLDPLGFGPPAATPVANVQLNGHANGSASGTPSRPKRTRGGFL